MSIVLADGHAVVREALPPMLRDHGVEVRAAVPTARAAAEAIALERPDLALVSLGVPDADEMLPLSRVVRGGVGTRLALYVDGQAEHLSALAIDHGAVGVVGKGLTVAEQAEALRGLALGGFHADAERDQDARVAGTSAPFRSLTAGERTILELLSRGRSTEAVARELHLSPHTVRTHVRNILRKLDVRTRAHAVAIAMREAPPAG